MKITVKNKPRIKLDNVSRSQNIPSRYHFQRWINCTLAAHKKNSEIHIRIVDQLESKKLNKTYRRKNKPTNVLSFPFVVLPNTHSLLLGDLVICAPVMIKEAKAQNKTLLAHWAHITIHGTLHLLGYDHIKNKDAIKMENLEIKLLKQLGYENPYE